MHIYIDGQLYTYQIHGGCFGRVMVGDPNTYELLNE